MRSSLVLGTVQLGLAYGIANSLGKPDQQGANAIVRLALNNGVNTFDTAQGYGDSEAVLGLALKAAQALRKAKVITKLSPNLVEDSAQDASALAKSLESSLQRLGLEQLYCVMLHREEHLAMLAGALGKSLASLKKAGLVKNIGISVYSTACALDALDNPLIDIVQLPASLFDRRFEQAGVFSRADTLGKEVHIRSVFLQGALLLAPEKLPLALKPIAPQLDIFNKLCAAHRLAPSQAALLWARQRYPKAKILFGAESARQVSENLEPAIWRQGLGAELFEQLEDCLPPQDEKILNPSFWKR